MLERNPMTGYSVTLNREMSNDRRTFAAGVRMCVVAMWRGRLRLALWYGCGPGEELRWVDPADVAIWRPAIGQRLGFRPDDGVAVTITAVESRGPGWHRARWRGGEYDVHDQELADCVVAQADLPSVGGDGEGARLSLRLKL